MCNQPVKLYNYYMLIRSLFDNVSKSLLQLMNTLNFSKHDSLAAMCVEYDCSKVAVSLRLCGNLIIVSFQFHHPISHSITKKYV